MSSTSLEIANIFHENLEYDKKRDIFFSFIRHSCPNESEQWINLNRIQGELDDVQIVLQKDGTCTWFVIIRLTGNEENVYETVRKIEGAVNDNVLKHDQTIVDSIVPTDDDTLSVHDIQNRYFHSCIEKRKDGNTYLQFYIASRNNTDVLNLESNFFNIDREKLTIKDLRKGMLITCDIVLNHIEFRDSDYQLIWYLHSGIAVSPNS